MRKPSFVEGYTKVIKGLPLKKSGGANTFAIKVFFESRREAALAANEVRNLPGFLSVDYMQYRRPEPRTVHMYDMRQGAKSGERTYCGRYISDVKWTAGYTSAGRRVKVTCKACLSRMPKGL